VSVWAVEDISSFSFDSFPVSGLLCWGRCVRVCSSFSCSWTTTNPNGETDGWTDGWTNGGSWCVKRVSMVVKMGRPRRHATKLDICVGHT
jgi:hypothetical protein